MKAAVYCRVSSDEQREKQSIKTQIDFATRYADLHEIAITEMYLDDGVSGGIPCLMRPEGARLLEDAQAGKFEAVLVYKVSRLGRSLLDVLQTAQLLEDYGVALRSMTEPFDTATPTGKFVMQMLGSMAELDKANIRENSMRGTSRITREGKWAGGVPPLGYKVVKKNKERCGYLAVDPGEAELVLRIFSLYLEEGSSLAQVANLLIAEGVPIREALRGTKYGDAPWHRTTVYRILTNRTYIGENFYYKNKAIKRNGQVVGRERTQPEEYILRPTPPIITPETFAQAARKLKDNNDRPANAKRIYLLSGVIKCAICGSAYSGCSPSGRNVFYYKCVNYMSGLKGERCPSAIVRGDLLEAEVWADIVSFAKNPGKVVEKLRAQVNAQARKLAPVEVEQDVIRHNMKRLQAERARVIGLVRKALISDTEAEAELTGIQQEIDTLEERNTALAGRKEKAQELQSRLDDTKTLLQRLAEAVEGATPERKRALIKLLVDGISVETVRQGDKKIARKIATYVFEVDPECISSVPFGSGRGTHLIHPELLLRKEVTV